MGGWRKFVFGKLDGMLSSDRRTRRAMVYIAVVFVVVLVGGNAVVNEIGRRQVIEYALDRRSNDAELAAAIVHERLRSLVEIGKSFATRVRFRR
jgi:hypothetical protein